MSERRREGGATDTNWDINDPDIPARIDLHVSFFFFTIVTIVTIVIIVTLITIVTINDINILARNDLPI